MSSRRRPYGEPSGGPASPIDVTDSGVPVAALGVAPGAIGRRALGRRAATAGRPDKRSQARRRPRPGDGPA